jgi:hypothetical protein
MTLGSRMLLERYGSRLKIAEALLRGEVDKEHEQFALELISEVMLHAAALRLGLPIKLLETTAK